MKMVKYALVFCPPLWPVLVIIGIIEGIQGYDFE